MADDLSKTSEEKTPVGKNKKVCENETNSEAHHADQNACMQGYESWADAARAQQREAARRAEEADEQVHRYRGRKQRDVNTAFALSLHEDRVLYDSPGTEWQLYRTPATTPPLYLDDARFACARRLPQMQKLLSNLQWVTSCKHHWKKDQGEGENMKIFMDSLGAVLEPSACSMEGVEGSAMGGVFAQPLQFETRALFRRNTQEACMYVSAAKVSQAKGMYRDKHGYVKVTLGKLFGEPITEWAHRLVLWATHGPPDFPSGWSTTGPHCLHICGSTSCLNPSHLVWGTAQDNKVDETPVYQRRLHEQGRDVISGHRVSGAGGVATVPPPITPHGHGGGGSVGVSDSDQRVRRSKRLHQRVVGWS